MGLEDLTGSSKHIDDLDDTNPDGSTDALSEGDDHIRGIKNVLKNSFPNLTTAMQPDGKDVAPIPSGTKMVFYQSSAPTGWTQDKSVNDRVLTVVNDDGGGTGGSWTISGLSVDAHALTVSEMPSHDHGGGDHTHSITMTDFDGPGGSIQSSVGGTVTTGYTNSSGDIINNEGGGDAHSHGLSSDGSWRPSHIDVIVASRD